MSRTLFSLAGFQMITIGRFWVIAEGQVKEMPTPSGANNLRANGINNNGVIVGFGGFSGKEKTFIAKMQIDIQSCLDRSSQTRPK
jgi:hypothetical protein